MLIHALSSWSKQAMAARASPRRAPMLGRSETPPCWPPCLSSSSLSLNCIPVAKAPSIALEITGIEPTSAAGLLPVGRHAPATSCFLCWGHSVGGVALALLGLVSLPGKPCSARRRVLRCATARQPSPAVFRCPFLVKATWPSPGAHI